MLGRVSRIASLVLVLAGLAGVAVAQTVDPCASSTATSDSVLSGRPFTVTWKMASRVPLSPTDPTLVDARIDGFFVQVDTGSKVDVLNPTFVVCADGTRGYRWTSTSGVPKGSHTVRISAWNFALDPATGSPTTTRQEGASVSRPFVAIDAVQVGPPPAPTNPRVWR